MATQGFSVLAIEPSSSFTNVSGKRHFGTPLLHDKSNSFLGMKVSVRPSISGPITLKRRSSTVVTIAFSLPTKREGIAPKDSKWSARALKAYVLGEAAASRLKYPAIGTEALLMGIMVEGTSLAAKFLRENGITYFKIEDAIFELLGKSVSVFEPPPDLPLTGPAQRALDWAAEEKLKSGEDGEITTTHLLLGIWSEKGYAGHRIMSSFGITDDKVMELAKNMDKDVIGRFK